MRHFIYLPSGDKFISNNKLIIPTDTFISFQLALSHLIIKRTRYPRDYEAIKARG